MSEAARSWGDSLPTDRPKTKADRVGRLYTLFQKNATVDSTGTNHGSVERKLVYPEVDQFITERAPDFFGMKVLGATPISRMRLLYKSLQKMPELDYRTKTWTENFNAEKANKLGDVALRKLIEIPVAPKEVIDSNGEIIMTSWTIRNAPTRQIFRHPMVRSTVIQTLREAKDPSSYIITKLDEWPIKQLEQPSESAIIGADRTYEQLLFGIWGTDLSLLTESLVEERFEDLDIPG